jgi:hypothetical protein
MRSTSGNARTVDDERVVARRVERDREVREHALLTVVDRRRLAVHQHRRAHDVATVELPDALVPEAHAEHRSHAGERLDRGVREPRVVRRAGTGRDDEPVGQVGEQLIDGEGIVADDLDLGAELRELLHQVVGEGVVVVDDEQAGGHGRSSDATEASVGPQRS